MRFLITDTFGPGEISDQVSERDILRTLFLDCDNIVQTKAIQTETVVCQMYFI